MNTDVLIIGAGVAGMTAAAQLAEQGISSLVVEKDLFPGGHAAGLSCKAIDSCAACNACLLEETLARVAGEECRLSCRTRVIALEHSGGNFQVTLTHDPLHLDPSVCVDCGLCYQACPVKDRAIRRSPGGRWGPGFGLAQEDCLFFQGRDCRACVDACPVEAVDLHAQSSQETISVRAIVTACGFIPFDPSLKPRYGYDRLPDVVSALELDRQLRTKGTLARPSDGRLPERVAFIQCVGSRDRALDRNYCSRVCCGYALRMAGVMHHRWPEVSVSMFYMDIQNTGRDFDRFYKDISTKIELIHGVPGEITASPEGGLTVPFVGGVTGQREIREFDLVVLSVGLGPPDPELAALLGLETDRDGFFVGKPLEGLFVAGAATEPLSVLESTALAQGVADRVVSYLKRKAD